VPTAREYTIAAETMAREAYRRGWLHGSITGMLTVALGFLILRWMAT